MKKILAKIEKQIDKLESAHKKEDDIVEAIKSLLEELRMWKSAKVPVIATVINVCNTKVNSYGCTCR